MTSFKECFECAAKPGSPTLCAQCLWVRENYKPVEPNRLDMLIAELNVTVTVMQNTLERLMKFPDLMLREQREKIRAEVERLRKQTDGVTIYTTPDDGFNEALDQAKNVPSLKSRE